MTSGAHAEVGYFFDELPAQGQRILIAAGQVQDQPRM